MTVSQSGDWTLGVDFGSVSTAAALGDPAGGVDELLLSARDAVMPSAVFAATDELLVGQRAEQLERIDPQAFDRFPKLRLAAPSGSESSTSRVEGEQLAAAVLSEVIGQATRVTDGSEPAQLVLTYADEYEATMVDGLTSAADSLGYQGRAFIVPDSIAAVASYRVENVDAAETPLLVVNLGAQYCEVSLYLREGQQGYQCITTQSIGAVVGERLDEQVRAWLYRTLAARDVGGVSEGLRMSPQSYRALERLSTVNSALIDATDRGQVARALSHEDFATIVGGVLEPVVELTRATTALGSRLNRSSGPPTLILTGAYADIVSDRLGVVGQVAELGDPRTIVARGAAYLGQVLHPPAGVQVSPPVRGVDINVRGQIVPRSTGRGPVMRGPRPPLIRHDGPLPPAPEAEPGAAQPRKPRRLLVDVTCDGQLCRKALVPNREHQLEFRIAVPSGDEHGPVFPEHQIPPGPNRVELVIDVRSDDGAIHGSAPMALPVIDRSWPSSIAAVSIPGGAEGSTLWLNVTVLFKNKPIQAAVLTATARAQPAHRDVIVLREVALSAEPEPVPSATAADAALEQTPQGLVRLHDSTADPAALDPVALDAAGIAAKFEVIASAVLGVAEAPDRLEDPAAVRLLVALATLGTRFAADIADLGLARASTIAILVGWNSPIIPFELIYDGDAPDDDATLCDCVNTPPADPSRGCPNPSQRRVCLYSFWGIKRVIVRTIKLRPAEIARSRPPIEPLTLQPVLFGAANVADAAALPDALPSTLLENELIDRVGSSAFKRVYKWPDWCTNIRKANPELLVVLGHTENLPAVRLIIGERSSLPQVKISPRFLATTRSRAPVVLLFACTSGNAGDVFGNLPGSFIDNGAAAVVATLTRLRGPHAATAAAAVVAQMHQPGASGHTLGTALTQARRHLVGEGLLVGLMLMVHGEIDVVITKQVAHDAQG